MVWKIRYLYAANAGTGIQVYKRLIMHKKKTLVLGASENPGRYSKMAIKRLLLHEFPVVAVGRKEGHAHGIDIHPGLPEHEEIDTVTMYLNPLNQRSYYDYILSLKPRRIIFNPGAENPELEELAIKQGIQTLEACTLVMLGTGQY